ncbi:MAG: hypothetical protein ACYDBB_24740 [Armatimonadota bacterium]
MALFEFLALFSVIPWFVYLGVTGLCTAIAIGCKVWGLLAHLPTGHFDGTLMVCFIIATVSLLLGFISWLQRWSSTG